MAGMPEVSCNQISTLDVSSNLALTWLQAENNQLTHLDVSNNPALRMLYVTNNQLTHLNVSDNPALTLLHAHNNQLPFLNVSNSTALTLLGVSNNRLTSLDVRNNTELTTLSVSNNQLTTLDVRNNTELTTLGVSNNQLTTLDVRNNTALTTLGVSNNQLTTLDVSNNPALTTLTVYNNLMTSPDDVIGWQDLFPTYNWETEYPIRTFIFSTLPSGITVSSLSGTLDHGWDWSTYPPVNRDPNTPLEFQPVPIMIRIPLSAIEGLTSPIQLTFATTNSWAMDRYSQGNDGRSNYGFNFRADGASAWIPESVFGVLRSTFISAIWTSTASPTSDVTDWRGWGNTVANVTIPGQFLENGAVRRYLTGTLNVTAMVRPLDEDNPNHWKDATMSLTAVGQGGAGADNPAQVRQLLQNAPIGPGSPPLPPFDITNRFTDPNFESLTRSLAGIPDTAPIYNTHVQNITQISASNLNITSLNGIQHFSNIENLIIQGNNLTELDLSGLHYLRHLNASNNSLTTLDVTDATALEALSISRNNIHTITGLNTLANLEVLWAEDNAFDSLTFHPAAPLARIDLRGNTPTLSRANITGATAAALHGYSPGEIFRPRTWSRLRILSGLAF